MSVVRAVLPWLVLLLHRVSCQFVVENKLVQRRPDVGFPAAFNLRVSY